MRPLKVAACAAAVLLLFASFAFGQPAPVKLWPGGAPGIEVPPRADSMRVTPQGEHVITHVQEPSITPFLPPPALATGAAVIVAPGGGHSEIWIDHEGYNVAKWLSSHGVAAFVLQYRLAREPASTNSAIAHYTVEGTELADMERAIRLVRSRAQDWGVDVNRVGVMGFSAGGELAELASTRPIPPDSAAVDPVDRLSSRPNFQALLYPAVPKEPRLSSETPPAFLACGGDDRPDISQGLPELYLALARLHVPAELHVYAGVGHGFGLRSSNPQPVAGWTDLFLDWLRGQGMLKQ